MAGASLLALLDDIATLLDDVAVLSKVAVQKTAGVLGDDLALNAQQLTGVNPARELPVVLAVAKGSLVNKAILVPLALAISAWLPWVVTPLLMIGGAYLCYEGVEKLLHKFLHRHASDQDHVEDAVKHEMRVAATADRAIDMVAFEKKKIAGAVRTDFVLSAEIIVIALGTVAGAPFGQRVAVLIAVALAMTVGVYGLVAGIVKLDDAGWALCKRRGDDWARRSQRWLGGAILVIAPYLMKFLSIAGTAAMFLVGGGILTHGIGPVHEAIHHLGEMVHEAGGRAGWLLGMLVTMIADALFGIFAGAVVVAIVMLARKVLPSRESSAHSAVKG